MGCRYGTPEVAFLSGTLMDASLKMRCDLSGAGYAAYWKEVNGKLTIAGDYVSPARRAALVASGKTSSFAEESEDYQIDLDGMGPVAQVYRTNDPVFIEDAQKCGTLKRRELACEYGIGSICLEKVQGGVIEYLSLIHI